jgi:hypothetical protein
MSLGRSSEELLIAARPDEGFALATRPVVSRSDRGFADGSAWSLCDHPAANFGAQVRYLKMA